MYYVHFVRFVFFIFPHTAFIFFLHHFHAYFYVSVTQFFPMITYAAFNQYLSKTSSRYE